MALSLMERDQTGEDAARLRIPPHSLGAEQSVLGSLLLESAALARIADLISAADFYSHAHNVIFSAIAAMVRRGDAVDVITVFDELEGEPEDYGGIAYLNALAQSVPSATNVRRYAEIVAERSTRRKIIARADEMAARAFSQASSPAQILEEAKADFGRLEQGGGLQTRQVPMMDLAQLKAGAQSVRWLIKHAIPSDSLGMLYGASGTFKSFIALDAALHVVHGLPWLGRITTQGPVLYIAAEGGTGLWPRVMAWHQSRSLAWQNLPFYVVPVALDLRADAWRVVDAAQALGVTPIMVVVDTFSQTYAGEENSANEVAAYLRELGLRFRQLWGCAVTIIHHSGHSATERPRGSSAIRANLDYLLGVFRDDKEMLATLTCEKQKDGELLRDATFMLSKQSLWKDDDGDEVSSLVARHLSSAEQVADAMENETSAGRGGHHQMLLGLVQNGMKEMALRKAFYDECGIATADGRRQAYHRAKSWAVKQGFIDVAQGTIITLKDGGRA